MVDSGRQLTGQNNWEWKAGKALKGCLGRLFGSGLKQVLPWVVRVGLSN